MSPQPIYLPRTYNPWEQYLPQFLSNIILQDQSQKFKQRMMETERAREDEQAKELGRMKLATTEGISEVPTEPYAAPPGGNVFTAYGKQYSYSPDKTTKAPTPFTIRTPEGREVPGVYNKDGTVSWVPKAENAEKLTDDIREYEFARKQGFSGTLMEFLKKAKGKEGQEQYAPDIQQYQHGETREVINVDVRNAGQVELAKKAGFSPIGPEQRGYGTEIGKKNAIRESKINEESAIARSQIATLDAMDNLLDRINTGKLAKVQMNLQQYANSLGLPVNVKNLGAKEAFNALGEQMALQSRNLGEGMVLAGQMSDRDVQFLRDMNAQLVMSKAGNKMILGVRKAIARRQNEVSNLMREFKTKNKGTFDATSFDAYLSDRFGKESIFGIPQGSKLIGNDSQTGLPAYETPDGRTIIPSF